ncbi:hypothetical protein [Edaphobacter modestus]|uniref:Uncharacterized protein n=1 Tax=Edaphobacter modestus TaxID=388466 RepID=A0A4Q7YPY7_9BACT|nr:hypothetical protein [Edaphobacter modestus]RZU39842.1 hypothetical protein BDD14_1237 [Edaphobacter modestus]
MLTILRVTSGYAGKFSIYIAPFASYERVGYSSGKVRNIRSFQ